MKKSRLLVALLALPLVVVGCGGSNPDVPPEPPVIEPDTYKIMVTCPEGVNYTLSKDEAEVGETVTLVIDSVNEGFSIKEVTLNNSVITPAADNKTYSFTMPDRSVRLVIKVDVSGDVVIVGDLAAKLVKEGNIYVARNVVANGSNATAKFAYQVKSGDTVTTLGVLDLDESKSFGTIGMTGDKTYNLSVGTGCTYDFYFDPDANLEYGRCYIQRVGVSAYPTTVPSLESILITNRTVRSEYAVYPLGYKHAHYVIGDNSTTDTVYLTYDYKMYENNVSFAKVVDNTPMSDKDPMFVYKQYDATNKLYTVVDTFEKYQGKKLINDDYYRPSYNNNTVYSAKFNVIEGDDWGQAYALNEKNALRNVRTSAHQPHYFVERDIMDAYRNGFGSDNGVSYQNIDIKNTPNADGSFAVTIDTIKEINTGSTGSSITGEQVECAYVYDVDMTFTKAGALTSLEYKEKLFDADKWDFVNHEAKTGQKGTTIKNISAIYEYGDYYAGAPSDTDFNLSDYFITSFNADKVQFFNSNLKDRHDVTSGESFVGIKDRIYFVDDNGEYNANLVNKKNIFEPATALDLWQYGPTASTNENAISKLATDSYYQMTAHDIGKSTLTFTNHVAGTGTSLNLDVTVDYVTLAWYFWIKEYDYPVTSRDTADVKAGGTYTFEVGVHRDTSPFIYHAVSERPDLLTITSEDNSRYLTINVSSAAAMALTSNTSVKVFMNSDYYENGFTAERSPLIFTIIPADVDPTGTWNAVSPDMPKTKIVFSEEAYDDKGNKKGYVIDEYYDSKGQYLGTDRYDFYYQFKDGQLSATMYAVDIETIDPSEGDLDNPKSFVIDFFYSSSTNYYYLFIAYFEYVPDYESYWYYALIGDFGDNVVEAYDLDNARYSPFEKKAA